MNDPTHDWRYSYERLYVDFRAGLFLCFAALAGAMAVATMVGLAVCIFIVLPIEFFNPNFNEEWLETLFKFTAGVGAIWGMGVGLSHASDYVKPQIEQIEKTALERWKDRFERSKSY